MINNAHLTSQRCRAIIEEVKEATKELVDSWG